MKITDLEYGKEYCDGECTPEGCAGHTTEFPEWLMIDGVWFRANEVPKKEEVQNDFRESVNKEMKFQRALKFLEESMDWSFTIQHTCQISSVLMGWRVMAWRDVYPPTRDSMSWTIEKSTFEDAIIGIVDLIHQVPENINAFSQPHTQPVSSVRR